MEYESYEPLVIVSKKFCSEILETAIAVDPVPPDTLPLFSKVAKAVISQEPVIVDGQPETKLKNFLLQIFKRAAEDCDAFCFKAGAAIRNFLNFTKGYSFNSGFVVLFLQLVLCHLRQPVPTYVICEN